MYGGLRARSCVCVCSNKSTFVYVSFVSTFCMRADVNEYVYIASASVSACDIQIVMHERMPLFFYKCTRVRLHACVYFLMSVSVRVPQTTRVSVSLCLYEHMCVNTCVYAALCVSPSVCACLSSFCVCVRTTVVQKYVTLYENVPIYESAYIWVSIFLYSYVCAHCVYL